MQIGDVLRSGERHDGRAPDYDDWQLNGDLLFYNPNFGQRTGNLLYGYPRRRCISGQTADKSWL